MPRISPADAVESLLYCGKAFVDQRLKLVVGEDVGPILLNTLPNQLAWHKLWSPSSSNAAIISPARM
jgi:hypothetical protein